MEDLNILIIEDNFINLKYLGFLLSRWNFNYKIAKNEKAAIEKAKNQKFSLIIIDLLKPFTQGIDLTKGIRKNSSLNSNTPIIAFSSEFNKNTHSKALQVGINELIPKPFYYCDIEYVIEKYCRKKFL